MKTNATGSTESAITGLVPHFRDNPIRVVITKSSMQVITGTIQLITANTISVLQSEDDESAVLVLRSDIVDFQHDFVHERRPA